MNENNDSTAFTLLMSKIMSDVENIKEEVEVIKTSQHGLANRTQSLFSSKLKSVLSKINEIKKKITQLEEQVQDIDKSLIDHIEKNKLINTNTLVSIINEREHEETKKMILTELFQKWWKVGTVIGASIGAVVTLVKYWQVIAPFLKSLF